MNYGNARYGGVTYPLAAVPSVYSTVTVNLRDFDAASTTRILWNENTSLGTTFSGDGLEQILDFLAVYDSGRVRIPIFGANRRFTPAFESTGRFIVTASDGETVEFLLANADLTETYDWTPTNSAEITAFVSHVRGLTDGDATLTLTMETIVLAVAPAFADDTGNAQTWTQSFAISAITVPEATGTPTPEPTPPLVHCQQVLLSTLPQESYLALLQLRSAQELLPFVPPTPQVLTTGQLPIP